MREALPAPSSQDPRHVLDGEWRINSHHSILPGPQVFGDDTEVPGYSKHAGHHGQDEQTDVLSAAVADLLGKGGSHPAFFFEACSNAVHDFLMLRRIGHQKTIPVSKSLIVRFLYLSHCRKVGFMFGRSHNGIVTRPTIEMQCLTLPLRG